MEIEIKTLDEVRDERVQVVITVDGATSTDPARRLYTAQEVGELQASEAELVATPLRGQIAMLKLDVDSLQRQLAGAQRQIADLEPGKAELEAELARRTREREERETARAVLESELERERSRSRAFDIDRRTEKDRADRAQARVTVLERDLEVSREATAQALNDWRTAYRQLRNVARAVAADRPHMRPTVEEPKEAFLDEMRPLIETIRDIRVITSPWADPPTSRTSQA